MPDLDESHHFRAVDIQLLERSGHTTWAPCVCGNGIQSAYFGTCMSCHNSYQDGKCGVKAAVWRSTDFIATASPVAVNVVTEVDVASSMCTQQLKRVTRPRSKSPRIAPSSSVAHTGKPRGRPPNGSRSRQQSYKGVRTRTRVRGYLVEIRPPKWKRTIWLGTYSTDAEAAAAYDAGVFYTKKKTQYNFPHLKHTFPPLPAELRLDRPADSDKIKNFVQNQAKEAAQNIRELASNINGEAPAVVSVPTDATPSIESALHIDNCTYNITRQVPAVVPPSTMVTPITESALKSENRASNVHTEARAVCPPPTVISPIAESGLMIRTCESDIDWDAPGVGSTSTASSPSTDSSLNVTSEWSNLDYFNMDISYSCFDPMLTEPSGELFPSFTVGTDGWN